MDSPVSASVRMRVPYYDVDLMQVVWNGNYLKYFEAARQALFRECGLDLRYYLEEKKYVFPVIRSQVKHVRPLRFDDDFICTATLKEAKVKIVLDFEIRKLPDGQICAKGRSEQAALRLPELEMVFQIPEEVREALSGRKTSGKQ